MAKRYFPQQNGDRKKAKLDVSISDHNFPLSQNTGHNSSSAANWGDDNEDEMLLLASQACEDAYNDISSLPDYSMCMQPTRTSTQLCDPGPSTSKTPFTFKKPTGIPSSITTNLKDKCNRIASPLPGISSEALPKVPQTIDVTDDLIFNDKIYKGQDSDYVYKQLLQLQEENTKLKSENGKLLEKCVTKEGEASILRTQLKTSQTAVDKARLERIKAQEKLHMEWTEKLAMADSQMHDLRTKLDFKNLEIISIKEKCRMLESNKVKLTQVTVSNNDISTSQRHKNNSSIAHESFVPHAKRVKTATSGVQTEDKALFVSLNVSCSSVPSKLHQILPLILEPTLEQHSLLDYNEKLQKHTDLSQNQCRIFSTFHRVPSTPVPQETNKAVVSLSSLYEDVASIATGEASRDRYYNLMTTIKAALLEVCSQLAVISHRTNTAFLKEMDERYMDDTGAFLVVGDHDLLSARLLYKEEQAVLARRMTAILACILESPAMVGHVRDIEENSNTSSPKLIDLIHRICVSLDSASCALLYSSLLLSIINVVNYLTTGLTITPKMIEVVKCTIAARPKPFVSCKLLGLVRRLSLDDGYLESFCPGSSSGNLKTDYDQGVLLYKKDSCYLQILWKQIEACLKCVEKQSLYQQAVSVTQDLVAIHGNADVRYNESHDKSRCDCQLVLTQVMVFALRICAAMLDGLPHQCEGPIPTRQPLQALCQSGIQALYGCWLLDAELCARLGPQEGHLQQFVELAKGWRLGEVYANMLAELSGTFQSSPEDMTSSFHRQAWIKSFETFSMAD